MIEVLRQARNAFVWNLNTDLDNIPACDQWAKMLRKNIDDLDKAIREHAMYEVQRLGQEIEQEPVAWKLMPRDATDAMLKAMDECSTEGYNERLYAGHAASVYMAAWDEAPETISKSKWVGLTEEEHTQIAIDAGCMSADWVFYGAVVERKLREKNTHD